ncbi:MAG: hypothetical protein GZ087_13660 [Flavobacterium sp.]|nr:hypothetical protein [Flavobacterium sp.]
METYSIRETITKTTPLSTYIQRVAMQATSQDNIVDKTSCFMINFPYGITVNNAQITINSASDYQLIQSNINAYSSDNDVVYIQYPVTVRLTDYSEKSITSQTAFNALLSQCLANSTNFGKINCLTIQYPITINVYNSSNQIATANGITNNQMLYNFFKNLEDDKFIAINYPVNITNSNGQNTSINSNSQFEDIIKNAVDSCPDNTTAPLDFMQIITSNSWKISYYFQNNVKTSIYDGYTFVFNSNYKVIATKSGLSYNGSWSTKVNNGVREFEVKFESDFLEKLDEDWKVFEFNNSKLCFSHKEDNSDTDYLYFEKN